jgi:release factor glutamine methyltransferase
MNLKQALTHATQTIGRHEALILLAHITNKSKAEILMNETWNLPGDENQRAFFDGVQRRQAGEPLQYILGRWDFYGLAMKADKRALIPRPETELLVEAVIQAVKGQNPQRILDVCTGSGCIAVALSVFTDAEITATDIDEKALSLAAENAALHDRGSRIEFIQTDLAEALLHERKGLFDIVVSNPPYIPTGDLAGLQDEIRNHEPILALDGGGDGMDVYRRLLPQAYALLCPGGQLFLEIGPGDVTRLAEANGFIDIRIAKDYNGLDRIIHAAKG